MSGRQRIVVAYSGDADTSAAVQWLVDHHDADVITMTLDLGQGRELERIRARALSAGAVRAHVLDVRDEFANDFVLRALQAGALHEQRVPFAGALAAPLIAKSVLEIARMEQTSVVAHGGRSGSDRAPLDRSLRALSRETRVTAPARETGMSPADAFEYATSRGISIAPLPKTASAISQTLWLRSIECRESDNLWAERIEDVYSVTKSPDDAPAEPAYIEVEFERGVPVAVNGITMPLTELIPNLETIAGVHGVGRIDIVENRPDGVRSRVVYEAPAAVVLHAAHDELERAVVGADLRRLKHRLSLAYADVIDEGLWFTPTREALDAFVQNVQRRVSGTVRVMVFKGVCRPVGVRGYTVDARGVNPRCEAPSDR